jgi:hypothetical protein
MRWICAGNGPSFTSRNPMASVPPLRYCTSSMFGPDWVTDPEARFAADSGWYRAATITTAATATRTTR